MKHFLAMKKKVLSRKDLQILRVIMEKIRINYSELARELNVSHTAIRKRINKMIFENKYVAMIPELNIKNLNFILALVFLEVATDTDLNKLLLRFSECPRIISIFKVMGEYNLVALVYAENYKVLDSILGSCMLRTAGEVRRSKVIPIQNILMGEYFRIQIPVKKYVNAPCGIKCYECTRLKMKECIGCPSTIYYRGWFALEKKN